LPKLVRAERVVIRRLARTHDQSLICADLDAGSEALSDYGQRCIVSVQAPISSPQFGHLTRCHRLRRGPQSIQHEPLHGALRRSVTGHVLLYHGRVRVRIEEPDAGVEVIYVDGQLFDFGLIPLTQVAKLLVLGNQTGNRVGALVFCHAPTLTPFKVIFKFIFGEFAP